MSFLRISPKYTGTVPSAMIFSFWNIVSFFADYNLLTSICSEMPELKQMKTSRNILNPEKTNNICTKIMKSFLRTVREWKVYFSQGIILIPSIALALLYLTVLSFDSITIGKKKSYNSIKIFIC